MKKRVFIALSSLAAVLVVHSTDVQAQVGPKFAHSLLVAWWQPIAFAWLEAESRSKQYLRMDLYVSQDYAFPPTNLGPLGTLLVNPGTLVYWQHGIKLSPDPWKPWLTGAGMFYPPIPRRLVGTKFRIQVVAYDAKTPNRLVLSRNYVTVTIN